MLYFSELPSTPSKGKTCRTGESSMTVSMTPRTSMSVVSRAASTSVSAISSPFPVRAELGRGWVSGGGPPPPPARGTAPWTPISEALLPLDPRSLGSLAAAEGLGDLGLRAEALQVGLRPWRVAYWH